MQIHEITLQPLEENVLRTIGQDIKGAVTEPFKKLQTIANTPGAWTSGTTAAAALDQRERAQADQTIAQQQQQRNAQVQQQTQQRATQLAQQWTQMVRAQPAVKTSASPQRSGQPSITIGGRLLTKGGDGLWHGETGAAVTDPAQAAKIDRAYQDQEYRKKQFQQTAIVREAPAEYTTQGGIVVPGGAKTDKSAGKKFLDWSDEQLASVIPGTKQEINMDMIRKDPALGPDVITAQNLVLKDPTNITAVQDYFVTAMQAMQQLSARAKQSARASRGGDQAVGVLGRVLDRNQLDKLKGLLQNPQLATQVKTELGIQ